MAMDFPTINAGFEPGVLVRVTACDLAPLAVDINGDLLDTDGVPAKISHKVIAPRALMPSGTIGLVLAYTPVFQTERIVLIDTRLFTINIGHLELV